MYYKVRIKLYQSLGFSAMSLSQDVLVALHNDLQQIETILLKMIEHSKRLHTTLAEIKLPIKKLNWGEDADKKDDSNKDAELGRVDFVIHEDKVDGVEETPRHQLFFVSQHMLFRSWKKIKRGHNNVQENQD